VEGPTAAGLEDLLLPKARAAADNQLRWERSDLPVARRRIAAAELRRAPDAAVAADYFLQSPMEQAEGHRTHRRKPAEVFGRAAPEQAQAEDCRIKDHRSLSVASLAKIALIRL
jgi:hypothetical protein